MRVVDRDTFLTLPPGTFYQKFYYTPKDTPYRGQLFDALHIKGDTLVTGELEASTFQTFPFPGVNFEGITTASYEAVLEDLANNRNATYSLVFGVWYADHTYDQQPLRNEDGPLFAVWDRQDVVRLVLRATAALKEGYALDINDNPFVEPIEEPKPVHPQKVINELILPEVHFDTSDPSLSAVERANDRAPLRRLQWRTCAPHNLMFWFVFNYLPPEDLTTIHFGNEMSGSLALELIDLITGERVALSDKHDWRAMTQELAAYFDGQFVKQGSKLRTSFLDAKPFSTGIERVYFTSQAWRDALDGRKPSIYLR
jgi:hypothetical protein